MVEKAILVDILCLRNYNPKDILDTMYNEAWSESSIIVELRYRVDSVLSSDFPDKPRK